MSTFAVLEEEEDTLFCKLWILFRSKLVICECSAVAAVDEAEVDCSAKKFCKDTSICDEAKAHLIQCGMKNLDHDGDGVPCEALCD